MRGPTVICCVPIAKLAETSVPASRRTCSVCGAPVWVADVNLAALEANPEIKIACIGDAEGGSPCVEAVIGKTNVARVFLNVDDLPPPEVLN